MLTAIVIDDSSFARYEALADDEASDSPASSKDAYSREPAAYLVYVCCGDVLEDKVEAGIYSGIV